MSAHGVTARRMLRRSWMDRTWEFCSGPPNQTQDLRLLVCTGN